MIFIWKVRIRFSPFRLYLHPWRRLFWWLLSKNIFNTKENCNCCPPYSQDKMELSRACLKSDQTIFGFLKVLTRLSSANWIKEKERERNRGRNAVWPDTGIKSAKTFSKSCPKSSQLQCLRKYWHFPKLSQKSTSIWTTLLENWPWRPFKNSLIWSHWRNINKQANEQT